jgi:hypothetical protein
VLQELAGATSAPAWAIASMLFFLGVWLAIAIATWRARPEAMRERSRLPLDGEADGPATAAPRKS